MQIKIFKPLLQPKDISRDKKIVPSASLDSTWERGLTYLLHPRRRKKGKQNETEQRRGQYKQPEQHRSPRNAPALFPLLMQQQALGAWMVRLPPSSSSPGPQSARPEPCPALTEPSHAGAALHSQFIVQGAGGQAGHGALERAACLCQASRRQEQQQRAGREQRGKVKRKENKIMPERKAQAVVQGSQAGEKV